ncbi:MAG: BTAD domain-containing putative transcriptional regulator [Roseiflexaceae bacterium]|nr:BTAD domain-containing putative transcriptional regulator [Roseiflexaceae bacterium]
MDAPLLLWVVGGILGFWAYFFLGSRTAYHPSTRWLRWSCVFAGLHFLLTALESPLGARAPDLLSSLRAGTGLIAIALWRGWLVGVRGLTRAERIARKTHLGVALNYCLFCLAIGFLPANVTFTVPAVEPWVAPLLIGVYLVGALFHIWLMTWRLHQREPLAVDRAASRSLLVATIIVCVSVIAVAGAQTLRRSQPDIAALIAQAGYGSLCCGIALMGYSALTCTQRRAGLDSGRDYVVSGFASLGIVAAYEGVLMAFHAATPERLAADLTLALGVVLIPVVIATHFGLDQLRDMLDWLRFGGSARQVRSMLRTITQQIGAEKPRDQVMRDVLRTLAQGLHAERIAVFWFEKDQARLIGVHGPTPAAPLSIDHLRAARLQLMKGLDGYEYLLPLCVGRKQRGALLIGGSGCGRWIADEQTQLEAVGLLLAGYIEHAASEPVTIPQHIHHLEQQKRDVQKLHDALGRVQSPSVFISTLGPFKVEVDGKPASYKEGRLGRHMLNGMLMYLVANVDKPVPRDALIEIAHDHRRGRRHGKTPPDDSHYISGLRKMLQGWSMADALQVTDTTVTLRRHSSWTTDTDRVVALQRRAEQAITDGQIRNAVELLEEALALYQGDYLQEFDARDYDIYPELHAWERRRLIVERRLLELYLDVPDLSDADRQRMLHIAVELLSRNEDNPDVANLVERVAWRCGDHRLLQRLSHLKRQFDART